MPTPESEAFLAKKPTVPPTFDGVDYDDNKRLKQAQDAIVREQWVNVMMGRLVREELSKCYYREGVNHLAKCGPLRGSWSTRTECSGRYVLYLRWITRKCTYEFLEKYADRYTEKYLQLLKGHKVRGFRFEQQNYVSKK